MLSAQKQVISRLSARLNQLDLMLQTMSGFERHPVPLQGMLSISALSSLRNC